MTNTPAVRFLWYPVAVFIAVAASCGGASTLDCRFYGSPAELAQRPSPPDSLVLGSDPALAKVCYSKPSVRGRDIFGGLEPWGRLWRLGANEPTIIHLAVPATLAGVDLGAGSYSLYAVPDTTEWTLVINASTDQWGLTHDVLDEDGSVLNASSYTPQVQAQEIARVSVETESIPMTETLTVSAEPEGGQGYQIRIDWETTRILLPFTPREN